MQRVWVGKEKPEEELELLPIYSVLDSFPPPPCRPKDLS